MLPNMDIMPGGITTSMWSIHVIHSHCYESNQQHTEQIGCDVKTSLFPPAGFTYPRCDSFIHLCVSVSISPHVQFPLLSSVPTQTLTVPNLDRVFLPTHPRTRSAYCVYPWCYGAPTRQTSCLPVMAAGWGRAITDYECVKLAECISVTPITVTFTPTSQLSR